MITGSSPGPVIGGGGFTGMPGGPGPFQWNGGGGPMGHGPGGGPPGQQCIPQELFGLGYIFFNPNLTRTERDQQLDTWAAGQNTSVQAIYAQFKANQTACITAFKSAIANASASLPAAIKAVVVQLEAIFNNDNLTRMQIMQTVGPIFMNQSDDVKQQLFALRQSISLPGCCLLDGPEMGGPMGGHGGPPGMSMGGSAGNGQMGGPMGGHGGPPGMSMGGGAGNGHMGGPMGNSPNGPGGSGSSNNNGDANAPVMGMMIHGGN